MSSQPDTNDGVKNMTLPAPTTSTKNPTQLSEPVSVVEGSEDRPDQEFSGEPMSPPDSQTAMKSETVNASDASKEEESINQVEDDQKQDESSTTEVASNSQQEENDAAG